MSLIAITLNDCYDGILAPVIIGDILFTSEGQVENFSLPTYLDGVGNFLLESDKHYPSGLVQKIYVVEDQFAIALAGDEDEMKMVLERFREYIKFQKINNEVFNKSFTKRTIKEFCKKEVPELALTDCSLCIFYADTQVGFSFVRLGNWLESSTNRFGFVTACASGAEDFITIARENYNPAFVEKEEINDRIFGNHLTLFGQLISLELITLETIKNSWGVNYEMITFVDGKFKKADNLTYLIIQVYVDLDSEERSVQPLFIYNSSYHNELLLINVVDVVNNRGDGFVVPPVDFKEINFDSNSLPPKLHFRATDLCVTYLFKFSNEETHQQTLYFKNYIDEDGLPLSHRVGYVDERGIEIFINPKIENNIINSAIQDVKMKRDGHSIEIETDIDPAESV